MNTTAAYLADAERSLLAARGSLYSAKAEMLGGRATRTGQLIDQVENCLAWAQRVSFYLESDQAASRAIP